jgi:hypothetical protein
MPTSEKTFRIELESMGRCLEHLQTLDLAGMEVLAATYGTAAERATIAAVRAFLATLP